MGKYALVNNNIVTEVIDVESDELVNYIKGNNLIIDVTDIVPQPFVGWILNGNKLELAQGGSDREQFEIDLNDRKVEAGTKLSRIAVNRIGARNKILNKSGAQVISLLTQLIGVKSLLETGALGTARASCVQLKVVFTEYTDIFDYVIEKINDFERDFGL